MKKIENNFAVTGFVAKDAEVRQFTTTSVARFPLAVARQEKNGEDTKRISAFMNIEAWRKNENTGSFDQLTKGTLLTVEGYFKPEEWTDKDGVLHNRIVTVAVKFYIFFRCVVHHAYLKNSVKPVHDITEYDFLIHVTIQQHLGPVKASQSLPREIFFAPLCQSRKKLPLIFGICRKPGKSLLEQEYLSQTFSCKFTKSYTCFSAIWVR